MVLQALPIGRLPGEKHLVLGPRKRPKPEGAVCCVLKLYGIRVMCFWLANWKTLLCECECTCSRTRACVCVVCVCMWLCGIVHCCHRTHFYLHRNQLQPPISPQQRNCENRELQSAGKCQDLCVSKGRLGFLSLLSCTDMCCTDKHLEGSSPFFEVAAPPVRLSHCTRSARHSK